MLCSAILLNGLMLLFFFFFLLLTQLLFGYKYQKQTMNRGMSDLHAENQNCIGLLHEWFSKLLSV